MHVLVVWLQDGDRRDQRYNSVSSAVTQWSSVLTAFCRYDVLLLLGTTTADELSVRRGLAWLSWMMTINIPTGPYSPSRSLSLNSQAHLSVSQYQ